jgi:phage shock protein A
VRSQLGRAAASRHLAQQQHAHLTREHGDLGASILTALASHRDDLAKPAIARQLDIEAQLPVLEASLNDFTLQVKELSGYVEALMGKKREMEKSIRDLERAQRDAETDMSRNGSPGSETAARVQAAQSSFDRTYQRQAGLDSIDGRVPLQQALHLRELNDLVLEHKINERLAALKTDI